MVDDDDSSMVLLIPDTSKFSANVLPRSLAKTLTKRTRASQLRPRANLCIDKDPQEKTSCHPGVQLVIFWGTHHQKRQARCHTLPSTIVITACIPNISSTCFIVRCLLVTPACIPTPYPLHMISRPPTHLPMEKLDMTIVLWHLVAGPLLRLYIHPYVHKVLSSNGSPSS